MTRGKRPTTTGRRSMVIGAALAGAAGLARAAPSRLPIPPAGRLAFRIMRGGSKIGEHHTVFDPRDDVLTVRAETEILVRMIGIPVFRYVHSATERWQAGTFTSLETRTVDDGTAFSVRVEREAAGLAVNGSAQKRYVAPPEALAMTHWNRAEIGVPKINPQKGDLLHPTVIDRGLERIASASGAAIPARHYNFSGQAILDVWYDNDGQWAALAFLGADQSQITLERQ